MGWLAIVIALYDPSIVFIRRPPLATRKYFVFQSNYFFFYFIFFFGWEGRGRRQTKDDRLAGDVTRNIWLLDGRFLLSCRFTMLRLFGHLSWSAKRAFKWRRLVTWLFIVFHVHSQGGNVFQNGVRWPMLNEWKLSPFFSTKKKETDDFPWLRTNETHTNR